MTRRTVKKLRFQEFSSVEEFLRDWDSSISGAILIEDKLPLHLHWTNKNAPSTVICFSAASSKVKEVPFWTGRGLTSGLDSNVLLVSDPSMILDRTMSLGWYAGSLEQPNLIETLTTVFRAVTADTRPIFFGASAGGWAALKYAARIDGAVAVAVNPQVDISRYMYFPYYLRKAWKTELGSEQLSFEGDVSRDFAEHNGATVVYVQNKGDSHHLNEHFGLFKSVVGDREELIELLPDLGPGHVAPAKESLVEILEKTIVATSASELKTGLQSIAIKSSGVDKEIQVSSSPIRSDGAMEQRYPVLFQKSFALSSSTSACAVELKSSVRLPEKAFVFEVHLDGIEMNHQVAKKLGISWSTGLQSAFFYLQPADPEVWNKHQDLLIPESATGLRIVVRRWKWDKPRNGVGITLRLSSKTESSEFSV